ncbi:hypothetical protein [Salinimicrobium sp. TH3]|uniref:hypothetical protein n=1 Tax=Salinimicrobium sp. TH3 TaxID=2997342 RepID=UPI0022728C5F|nr:hypothetical protein [Salinimicrobium sp. TH3]MCY2687614.1 hypothetical protein [Salinimicrobium sp. TH3]
MKKLFLSAVVTLFTMSAVYSQQGNFSIGINGGIPVGDIEEFATFNLGGEVAYRFGISEQFEAGALVGYSHFFGDSGEDEFGSWEVEDFQFLPLAASARFNMESFFAGADVGYAVGVNEDNEGGFYYKPHVGMNFGKIGVLASYSGISRDSFTVSSVNLGIEYKL